MNLPAPLSPATARSARLPFAATDAAKRSTSAATNSFSSDLDRAVSPVRERALAQLRTSRGRAADGGDTGDSRTEPKPIKEGRKKGREESQESLAGAYATAPPPTPCVELDHSQGRPMLRPPPGAAGDTSDTLDVTGLTTQRAPVAPPPSESIGTDGKADANVPVKSVPVANAESSIVVETVAANSSVDANKEFVSAGQTPTDDSLSAGTDELIELVPSKSELTSPLQTDLNEAPQGWSTNDGEGLSALQKELVDGNENSRGIAPAKLDAQMKTTVKQDEIAGSTKQIMPGAQTVQLRPARVAARTEGRRNLEESVLSEALVGAASAKDTVPTAGTEFLLASDVLTGRLSPVDRMTKVISREVQIFKRTADETMEVVLTPDQHTQISLRLQWREGKVEILALCHQGDYHTLNTQWPQLQTALAHQGVRLSQLTQPAHTGYTEFFSSAGFTQSQNGGQRQPEPMVALDKMPPGAVIQPARKTQPSAAARARRLLESWA